MKEKLTILGIHDGHNSGAAIVSNGRVLAAINEERLNNIKNFSGPPLKAIEKVIEIAGIRPGDIDVVAMAGILRTGNPLTERTFVDLIYERVSPYMHSRFSVNLAVRILSKFRKKREIVELLQRLGLGEREIINIEHHTCHAACAYYQRPWEDKTLVLTLDGSGDGLCSSVNIGEGYGLRRVASSIFYDSPSNVMYSEVTGYLGLKRWEHEYKVMGMAPYGKPEYCLKAMTDLVRINPRKPLQFQNTSGAYLRQVQNKMRKKLAEQRFDNISAACQAHFENLVTEWVKNCIQHTGVNKVAFGGGSFLNVKANKLVREMKEVDEVFFYPACDDGGVPVGAALEAYYRICEREGIAPQRSFLTDIYYGADHDDDVVKQALERTQWLKRAQHVDDIESEVAGLLARGKIVARFSGRDEWGPRALGNRSILADPRDMRVIRQLNFAIKQRDFWMPFAPAILEEHISDYLLAPRPARYMIEAFETTEKAEEIIAGLHPFDMTARPQTVNGWNPPYRKILEGFRSLTGVSGIVNTSFNLHGFPIVGTPEVALWTLEKSSLDALAIGHWLVVK